LRKRCAFCGRYFIPDYRVGEKQKACGSELCKKKRKRESQKRWSDNNPGYFRDRYSYVKEWRRQKKMGRELSGKVIQDEIAGSKSMATYILLIPERLTGVIQDEIILRRLTGSTFAAYG